MPDQGRADAGEEEGHGVDSERQPPRDGEQQRRQRRTGELRRHRQPLLLRRAGGELFAGHDPAQRRQDRAGLHAVDQAGEQCHHGQQIDVHRPGQQRRGDQTHQHGLKGRRHHQDHLA
jgi:hypothetical protein